MIKGFLIAKQYVYDKNNKPVGYEILFREKNIKDYFYASLVTFNYIMENASSGYVFLNVEKDFLLSDVTNLIKPEKKIVLELMEDIEISKEVINKIVELKRAGFLFSINRFNYIKHDEFIPYLDFAKLDIKDDENVFKNLNKIKSTNVKPIAFKVENEIFYKISEKLGFEYFQGFYFSNLNEESFQVQETNEELVLKILNSVIKKEDITKIEEYFKLSPNLVTKLLIYVNSANFYFKSKINSLRKSIAILGYKNLEKWLLFELFYSNNNLKLVLERATFRGKLMELIIQDIDSFLEEKAFLVGMLSLISSSEIFNKIDLETQIVEAIKYKKGILGEILSVIEDSEKGEFNKLRDKYNINPEKLIKYELQAFSWFDKIKNEFKSTK